VAVVAAGTMHQYERTGARPIPNLEKDLWVVRSHQRHRMLEESKLGICNTNVRKLPELGSVAAIPPGDGCLAVHKKSKWQYYSRVMRPVELQLLLLILAANGAPVLGAAVFGQRGNRPVDGGRVIWDGRPLFGRSKTWRGIALALIAVAVMAGLLGLSPGLSRENHSKTPRF